MRVVILTFLTILSLACLAYALTYKELAVQFEEKYRLPSGLLAAICEVESNWRSYAIGNLGEIGLCQVRLGTLRMLCPQCDERTLLNPYDNLHIAARYLDWLRRELGTDDPDVLAAAYNAGPNNQIVRYMLRVRSKIQ